MSERPRRFWDWLHMREAAAPVEHEKPAGQPPAEEKTYRWPEASPPDQSDPFWASEVICTGQAQYKRAEVSPGLWQWVIDKEAMRHRQQEEKERLSLWWALRTRILTEEEMKQVQQWGLTLVTGYGVSYDPEKKARELNEALYNQAKLQLLAKGDEEMPPVQLG